MSLTELVRIRNFPISPVQNFGKIMVSEIRKLMFPFASPILEFPLDADYEVGILK